MEVRAEYAGILEAQVAMISPWIRKFRDTLTRTLLEAALLLNRISSDSAAPIC